MQDLSPVVQPSQAGMAVAPVASRKRWSAQHKVTYAVVAVLLLGVVTGFAVGSVDGVRPPAMDTSESSIDNPASLSESVKQSLNANLADSSNDAYGPGVTVKSSDCIKVTGRQYACLAKLTDGSSIAPVVMVSEDGSTLISRER